MSQAYSQGEDIGETVRLPAGERGFTLALAVSAALHAALLILILSFVSGYGPRAVPPLGERLIMTFLVPGHHVAERRSVALPTVKGRAAEGASPVTAPPPEATPRAIPAQVAPVEKVSPNPPVELRPPVERPGSGHEAGPLPANAPPVSPVTVSGGTGLPAGTGAGISAGRGEGGKIPAGEGTGISAARQGGGEFAGGTGAGASASRPDGRGEPLPEKSRVRPWKDEGAVPRYGDNARPVYPPLARLRGYQGVVILYVEVLADGRVGQAEIKRSAGHDILDRAALEAVRSWKFEPGRRAGRAVTMSVEVPVRFVLNESPDP